MVEKFSEFRDFKQALACTDHSLPYKFTSIFNADTWSSRSLSGKKFRLLRSFDALLSKMLNADEMVYYISFGVQSSFFEQFFLGWVMYYLNRQVFIFTTKRILLIQFKGKYKPWDLFAQIAYQNVKKVKQTFFGNVKFYFTGGESSFFISMPKYDRKNIVHITNAIREKMGSPTDVPGSNENLCPYCFTVVQGFPRSCSNCNKPFKSRKKAGLLSLVFPGLGDFYLGHKTFAVLEMFGAACAWISLFLPTAQAGQPTTVAFSITSALVLFALMHGLDCFVTSKIAKKGIYPIKRST